jgi:hypothetical protein
MLSCLMELAQNHSENCPEFCRKKPTQAGTKVAHEKAAATISRSPGSPPILKYPGMVWRSVLFQY